ncbi:hypothetical protein HK101_007056 [Irineochytrium annulatum]|nr:hypothetical protein HK101_007056 [Irineochytrium annulatum]
MLFRCLVVAAVGAAFITGLVYLHAPVLPIPTLRLHAVVIFPHLLAKPTRRTDPDASILIVDPASPRDLHIVWLAKHPAATPAPAREPVEDGHDQGHDPPVALQLYSIPLGSLATDNSTSASSTDMPPPSKLAARLHASRRLEGRVHLVSMARHMSRPAFAFVRYRVEGESATYHADVVEIGADGGGDGDGVQDVTEASIECLNEDGASLLGAGDDTVVVTDGYWSCQQPGRTPHLLYKSWEFPGNMWVHRFSYGLQSGRMLYSRQLDAAMFRLIPSELRPTGTSAMDSPKIPHWASQAGPKHVKNVTGTSLVLLDLYAEGDGQTVMDIRYNPTDDDDYIDFQIHLFHRKTSISNSSKAVVFIYHARIFSIDYDPTGPRVPEDGPGYVLRTRRVAGLPSSQLRMKGAVMNGNGTMAVFVNDLDGVLTVTRSKTYGADDVLDDDDEELDPRADPFAISASVSQFFDGVAVGSEYGAGAGNAQKGDAAAVPRWMWKHWVTETFWTADLAGLHGDVGTGSISSLAIIPREVEVETESADDEGVPHGAITDDHGYIALLYDSGVLLTMDSRKPRQGSFLFSFIVKRLEMIIAMVSVVLFFVGNETRR